MDKPSLEPKTPYVKTDWICCRLGIGRNTVAAMVKKGTLPPPAIYVGRRPRWDIAHLRVLFPAI